MITLRRQYTPWGTLGDWDIDGKLFKTLERPWLGNSRGTSCIPEGVYELSLRDSPVVSMITNGRHQRGWEVKDVHDRTFIMVHPGNYIEDSDGCILIGERHIIHENRLMVTNSQSAFNEFMALMEKSSPILDIRQQTISYP